MSTPTLEAGNVDNLAVGKGIVSFMPAGYSEFRDIGEVKEFEVTLTVEELNHFTQRAGVRSKDLVVVIERSGNVRMVMEEWTPFNLGLMMMGSVNEAAVGGPEITIMSEDSVSGVLKFHGTNSIGPRYDITLDNVRFKPSSSIRPISDEWAPLEITGEILLSDDTSEFGRVKMTNLNTSS